MPARPATTIGMARSLAAHSRASSVQSRKPSSSSKSSVGGGGAGGMDSASIFSRTEVDVDGQRDIPGMNKFLRLSAGAHTVKEEGFSSHVVDTSFRSDALKIEVALNERLRIAVDPLSRFQIFESLFTEIIQKDKTWGFLLKQIKHEYDLQRVPVDENSVKAQFFNVMQQLRSAEHELGQTKQEKTELQQHIQHLEERNAALEAELNDALQYAAPQRPASRQGGSRDHQSFGDDGPMAVSNLGWNSSQWPPMVGQHEVASERSSNVPSTTRSSYYDDDEDDPDTARAARHGYDQGVRPKPEDLRQQIRPSSVPSVSLDNVFPVQFPLARRGVLRRCAGPNDRRRDRNRFGIL